MIMNDSNHHLWRGAGLLCLLLFCGANDAAAGAAPVVSSVRAAQRPGTKLVDIYYDLADSDSATLAVSVAVSTNGGASYTLPATSFSGSGWGSAVTPGSSKQITWNATADWNGRYSANVRFRVTADDAAAPGGMALVPAGSFTMGNCMNSGEGYPRELPLHTVYVSAFCMDRYEVTKALWDTVYQWAIAHGYKFDYAGSGKASTHPVQTIDWYDCVKWCNARSEKEGRLPAYYTDAGLSVRYRIGQVDVQTNWVNWSSGYRLPTEAEWEKAARGGASGHRFPWSDADTIIQSRANYYSYWSGGHQYYPYDLNATAGYHPTFNDGISPYTSPVGYFAANGYGLYDMAGNVWEWCWDWWGSYSSGAQTDPHGPTSGSDRVYRGGGWDIYAFYCRTGDRDYRNPADRGNIIGFRPVLPAWAATSSADSNVTAVDTRDNTLTVSGRVRAAADAEAISGAAVSLGGQNTTTAGDGTFTLSGVALASGNTLSVSKSGFMTDTETPSIPAGSKSITLGDILLQAAVTGKPVVTKVEPGLKGLFLSGASLNNDFTASVNWNGLSPGYVRFYANDAQIADKTGSGPDYVCAIDMAGASFRPAFDVSANKM
jgi:formylglycine-generating enzyme